VQQALDNVAAHASASRVNIKLAQNDGRIHFSITDDGQGFTELQRTQAEQRGSFGLKSMEARITSLGGEFAIQSGSTSGTKISGWLPVVASISSA